VRTIAEVLRAADQWAAEPLPWKTYLMRNTGPAIGQRGSIPGGRHHQMMMWIIGVAFFALCILVSVALHECGHMWAARATGMKVRRYSSARPHAVVDASAQQAGLHRIRPQGGPAWCFCDIAGMTAIDEIRTRGPAVRDVPAENLEAGAGAVRRACDELRDRSGADLRDGAGLGASESAPPTRRLRQRNLLRRTGNQQRKMGQCTGEGPGAAAGIRSGDIIVKVGDTDVHNPDEMVAAVP